MALLALKPLALVFVAASAFHALLIPAYHSTDLEVHRHWLSLTHALPPACWYVDATSRWTLDYPPMFAYFEWLLSKLAAVVAPEALELTSTPVESHATILFQRWSVIISSAFLFVGVAAYALACGGGGAPLAQPKTLALCGFLLFFNAGLAIVDYVHFQYNGVLLGVLFLCMSLFRFSVMQRTHSPIGWLVGSALFVVLVLLKHLFVVLAPLVVILLWRGYVMEDWGSPQRLKPTASARYSVFSVARRCFTVLSVAAAVGSAIVFPVLLGQCHTVAVGHHPHDAEASWLSISMASSKLVLARLFPFNDRGLVHDYWAPNVWALYYAADRAVSAVLCRGKAARVLAALLPVSGAWSPVALERSVCGAATAEAAAPGSSSLLTTRLQVFPAVPPHVTALCVALAMAPLLMALWRSRKPARAIAALLPLLFSLVYWCAFLFGWHVHEKASLYALLPAFLGLLDRDVGGEDNESVAAVTEPGVGADDDATVASIRRRQRLSRSSVHRSASPTARVSDEAAATHPAYSDSSSSDGNSGVAGGDSLLWRWQWLLTLPVVYSQHPLLFTPMEQPLIILLLLSYALLSWCGLRGVLGARSFACSFGWKAPPDSRLPWWCQAYSLGFVRVHMVCLLAPRFIGLPFLPLLLTSLYCALGVCVYVRLLYRRALRGLLVAEG